MATPTDITLADGLLVIEQTAESFPQNFFGSGGGLDAGIIRLIPSGYADYAVDDIVVFAVSTENKAATFNQMIGDAETMFTVVKTEDIRFKYVPPVS